jgi:uncharacterized SAM-binding protein YcdF (DUF218 family)
VDTLRRARRAAAWTLLAFLVFGVAPTLTPVRHALSWPLIAGDPDARGDAAYVMHGGPAMEERLRAAADLYHMGRAPRIFLLRDDARSMHSFVEKRSLTRSEWMLSYLAYLGVPRERVTLIPDGGGSSFGSLHEADLAREALPPEVRRLVAVTSPVHTLRAGFTLRRRLAPRGIEVATFAATAWETSAEAHAPLWLEYAKVVVYWVVA